MKTTPSGVAVNPAMTAAQTLLATAELYRIYEATGFKGLALPMLMQETGASADTRFHALGALRKFVFGHSGPGPLADELEGLSPEEIATLLERAALDVDL